MSSQILEPIHFNSVEQALVKSMQQTKVGSKQDQEIVVGYVSSCMNLIRQISVWCVTLQYQEPGDDLYTLFSVQTEYLVSNKTKAKKLSVQGLYNALCCIRYQIEIKHLTKLRDLTDQEQDALDFLETSINNLKPAVIDGADDETCNWSIS